MLYFCRIILQRKEEYVMKRGSIVFLKIVILLIAVVTLAALLWEPQLEGVNAHATNFEIYFKDPFLALVYAGSIPFFIALYQTFKVLEYTRQNNVFSQMTLKAVRTIKYCAIAIICFVAAEELFIMLNHGSDDPAGGVFMGIIITFGSLVIATVATVFEKILRNAVDMKSENDLTI